MRYLILVGAFWVVFLVGFLAGCFWAGRPLDVDR